MSNADIRISRPYFRFKRGHLTLFIEVSFTNTVATLKNKLLTALGEHGAADEFAALTANRVRLVAERHDQQQTSNDSTQYRLLDDSATVSASDITDEQIIYFVLQLGDGTWEEPYAADYDADAHDMDVMYA
ncbi:hypothetical protein BX070DRAFT_223538 [Coemansia spiralis]|nr:hypothetical protein BX070DRAFT_223538 [Coemansia spiralis]